MVPGLILVAIMIGALVGAVYISRWLVKRGMRHVVLAFRERGATDYEHAVTAQELGVVRGASTTGCSRSVTISRTHSTFCSRQT